MVVTDAGFRLRAKLLSDGGMAVLLLHHFSVPKAIAWKIYSILFLVIQTHKHGYCSDIWAYLKQCCYGILLITVICTSQKNLYRLPSALDPYNHRHFLPD